jgi:hypothetical protein
MPDILIRQRLLDIAGLNILDAPEQWSRLYKEVGLQIAILQAMGAQGAVALGVDSAGNLKVASQPGVGSSIFVRMDSASGTILLSAAGATLDTGGGNVLAVAPYVFDGSALMHGVGSASAINISAQSGLRAALSTLPGQWSITANAALGAQSTASKAAGAAGVRHICTGYSIVISSQAAPAAGTLTINIRDGASGAGTILEAINLQIPAALYAPVFLPRSGLSLVGTAATAMTIESSAAYAAVGVSVNLEGYDAS